MAELSDLEHRIAAALDRISASVELLGPAQVPGEAEVSGMSSEAAVDSAELVAVREALEAERTANAQLEERVKAIKQRQEEQVAGLQAELAQLRSNAETAAGRNRQLKRRLDEARGVLQQLSAAGAEIAAEPHLINRAMMAELEGLRAMRDADRAELDTLLAAIEPLVGETHHA